MKKLFSFSLKLLMSILFTLLLIEIGLRLWPGLIPLDLLVRFHEDPRAQIARRRGLPAKEDTIVLDRDDGGPELRIFKPFTPIIYEVWEENAVRRIVMDEIGFCNPPGSYERATIDIITIGDSFTYCHAVYPQDSWTSQLGSLTGYTTYNLGRGGVGIHEYLQILKKFGLQKSPEIVIMNIYEGNDLRDTRRYYKYWQSRNSHESVHHEQKPLDTTDDSSLALGSSYEFIMGDTRLRYSYAINLILALLEYGQERYSSIVIPANETAGDVKRFKYSLIFPGDIAIPFNIYDTDKDEVKYAKLLRDRQIEIEVQMAMVEALQRFVELGQKHSFTPVVTYMPSAHTAYESVVRFVNPELSDLMPWFSREQRQFLQEQSQALGFVFIDLTPALQAAAQSGGPDQLLYLRGSVHLSSQGNTAVAKILSQKLAELGIIHRRPAE